MCQINSTAIFKFLVLSLAVLLTSASSTWAADEQSLREAINQAVRTHVPYVRILGVQLTDLLFLATRSCRPSGLRIY